MRIVNITYRYFPEKDHTSWIAGFGFYYTIWEELAKRHDVVCVEHIDYSGEHTYKGIRYFFQKISGLSLLLPFGLHRFLRRLRPDAVVVHSLMFPLQVILLRYALGKNVQIVVQHHAEQAPANFLKRVLQRWADRSVDLYFFSGKGLSQQWIAQRLVGEARVKEVMEVTSLFRVEDKDAARLITKINSGKAYIWVGHLNENKNPLLVVRSFIAFLSRGYEADLYLVFQSERLLPEIKEYLQQHLLWTKHIHLVGKVPHEDLQHWFSSADFIISSSAYEGSGVAVCEAMSCGCIPLLSAIPSFLFMTGDTCGLLYEAGNGDALVNVLEKSAAMDLAQEKEKTLLRYRQKLSAGAIASDIEAALGAS